MWNPFCDWSRNSAMAVNFRGKISEIGRPTFICWLAFRNGLEHGNVAYIMYKMVRFCPSNSRVYCLRGSFVYSRRWAALTLVHLLSLGGSTAKQCGDQYRFRFFLKIYYKCSLLLARGVTAMPGGLHAKLPRISSWRLVLTRDTSGNEITILSLFSTQTGKFHGAAQIRC